MTITTNAGFYMPLAVGISAVAATLAANTLLELFKRRLGDRRTAQALAACLIAELEIRLGAARGAVAAVDNPNGDGDFVFVVPERHPFYASHLKEIGLLKPDAAAKVVRAYAQVEATAEFVRPYAKLERVEGLLIATVAVDHRLLLKTMNAKQVELVGAAIAALKKAL